MEGREDEYRHARESEDAMNVITTTTLWASHLLNSPAVPAFGLDRLPLLADRLRSRSRSRGPWLRSRSGELDNA